MSSYQKVAILVVLPGKEETRFVCKTLANHGMHVVESVNEASAALKILSKKTLGLIIIDISLRVSPHKSLFEEIASHYPHLQIIVITNNMNSAIECMKYGASDLLSKPIEPSRLIASVQNSLEIYRLKREVQFLKAGVLSRTLKAPEVFKDIITDNENMKQLFQYMELIASTPKPVLITGETGVGKELFAKAIHVLSDRKGKFISINAAGLDDNVFSDTLFGHKPGAFTGADRVRPGMVETAEEGTLFLDEIGDMNENSQIKLLRLLQEKEYQPLGSDDIKTSNARIVAATNADLGKQCEQNLFRRDLYYRLSIHQILIPPLRDRKGDVTLLIEHFLNKSSQELKVKPPNIKNELISKLTGYSFPGNVRELETLVYDAVSRGDINSIQVERRAKHLDTPPVSNEKIYNRTSVAFSESHLPTLKECTDLLIKEALRRSGGKQLAAAKSLGMSQQSLSQRLIRNKHLLEK